MRAVRNRAAGEVVPLDRSLKALTDAGARDLHLVAGLEDLDGDVLALDRLCKVPAELDEVPVGAIDTGLGEVASLPLRDLPLRDRLPRELDGLVAVGIRRANCHDGTRTGFDDGHRRHAAALLVEELRHAELLAYQALHLRA